HWRHSGHDGRGLGRARRRGPGRNDPSSTSTQLQTGTRNKQRLTQEKEMATKRSDFENAAAITREDLVDLLNEDLAREYQAIISYVVYSQVLKGAKYMNIAAELEIHAGQELQHALIIASQIDYLGGMPEIKPKPVKTSEKAEDMLRFDL